MTLRINIDRCSLPHHLSEELPEGGGRDLDYVTRALALAMWNTHIGKITVANRHEVMRRVKIAEEINGPYMSVGPKDQLFTQADVERRVGMVLNVTTKTKSEFDKDVAYSRAQKGRT